MLARNWLARSSQQGVAGDVVDVDLGPVVFFAREAVPMPASRSVLTMSEELIVDGAHVLFADVGYCPWAARAPAETAASEGGLSGSRLDCGERERVDDVVH